MRTSCYGLLISQTVALNGRLSKDQGTQKNTLLLVVLQARRYYIADHLLCEVRAIGSKMPKTTKK